MAKNDKKRSLGVLQEKLSRAFKNRIQRKANKLAGFFCQSQGLCFPSPLQDLSKSLTATIQGISKRLALAEWCLENEQSVSEYRRRAVIMLLMQQPKQSDKPETKRV